RAPLATLANRRRFSIAAAGRACSERAYLRRCRRPDSRRDGADRLRLVDAQNDALADIEVIMDAVLAAVAGAEILAEHQHADPRIDQHAALDRRLVDAGRGQPAQMFQA